MVDLLSWEWVHSEEKDIPKLVGKVNEECQGSDQCDIIWSFYHRKT